MTLSDGADEAALERTYNGLHPLDPATAEIMLKEAKGIMDQLGVVFFLRQGTCLGAIRDNGFIPWDDDLDLGSVIGLHGLAAKSIDQVVNRVVTAFRDNGYFANVGGTDQYISVAMIKSSIRMDWVCHRIIDDSIFQYPGVRFPARLFTELKEIDFVGEKFLVPNPPEEYLRFKYGEDWMTPKELAYEKDVVQLIPEGPISGNASRWRQFFIKHLLPSRAGRLRVFDQQGEPVPGAEVVIAGLSRSKTNGQGYAKFYLPRDQDDYYALVIRYHNHEEVLYQEQMSPGGAYVYRPDSSSPSGRFRALSQE